MALKYDVMKKLLYMILFALLVIPGCSKPDAEKPLTLEQKLCNEWRGSELSVDAAVYVSFLADGTFELYQKMEEGFELRRGTWTLTGDVLSGKYNDNEDWAADYTVSVEGNKLTMISRNEGAETSIYVQCAIPSVIKEGSTVIVKSVWL